MKLDPTLIAARCAAVAAFLAVAVILALVTVTAARELCIVVGA